MNDSHNEVRGEYFPWVEYEGIDRRYAVLEISTEELLTGEHRGEVYDTITHQLLWRSGSPTNEDAALQEAELVLQKLEQINGFGSISLQQGFVHDAYRVLN